MSVEITSAVIMVSLMFCTMAAKYLTATRLLRHRDRLSQTESEVRGLRGQLKVVEHERDLVERQENALNRKKTRLEKRIPDLVQQLQKLDNT